MKKKLPLKPFIPRGGALCLEAQESAPNTFGAKAKYRTLHTNTLIRTNMYMHASARTQTFNKNKDTHKNTFQTGLHSCPWV